MLLFIDTSDFEIVRLALVSKGVVERQFQSRKLSEVLLPEIKKFCKKQKTSLDQLKKIAVVVGPGGFSRIRTAVATANALGFALNIPIAGVLKTQLPANLGKLSLLPTQKMVKPMYDKEPNITMPK